MGIMNDNSISVVMPIEENATEVKITVNGLTQTLKWINPEDKKQEELYNEAYAKIENHPNKDNGMIFFQYNPTCFWYWGKLY